MSQLPTNDANTGGETRRAVALSEPEAKPLVFAVDDEPMLLELAAMVLEPLGYHVRTFRDPGTALRAFSLANPRPALIVTDFAMHSMNGMDFIRECRRMNPGQKLFLSVTRWTKPFTGIRLSNQTVSSPSPTRASSSPNWSSRCWPDDPDSPGGILCYEFVPGINLVIPRGESGRRSPDFERRKILSGFQVDHGLNLLAGTCPVE